MKKLILSVCVAALVGCTSAPSYAPTADVPPNWVNGAANSDAATQLQWWQQFNDPVLNQLIKTATAQNLDVKIAATRVRAARAQLLSVEAGFLPNVSGDASVQRSRRSGKTAQNGNFARQSNLYDAQIDASWQFNIFGISPAIEAADATIKTQEENKNAVLLSLLGEVADNYIELRRLQQSLTIIDQTIATYQDSLEIAAARRSAGLTTELDPARATAILETQKAQRPATVTQINAAMRRLEVLLGQNPGTLNAQLQTPAPVPVAASPLLLATPAAVIANRPDVRSSEQDLIAKNAARRVATAQYFPSVSLPAAFGWQAQRTGDLIGGGSLLWSLAAGINVPIFDFGRIRADINLADANAEESFLNYQKTVQGALSDVETALSDYLAAVNRAPQLAKAVDANQTAVAIAQERYKSGLTNYLEVTTAEQSLYESQQSALQNQADMSSRLVTLYKAMGGGWQGEGVQPPVVPDTTAPPATNSVTAPVNTPLPQSNVPRVKTETRADKPVMVIE